MCTKNLMHRDQIAGDSDDGTIVADGGASALVSSSLYSYVATVLIPIFKLIT